MVAIVGSLARLAAGGALAAALAITAAVAVPPPLAAADPSDAGDAVTRTVEAPAPRVVWRGRTSEKIVALTFDDGWSTAALRAIQRTLVREGVPATFFVNGVYVQRDPALWRSIATRFPLANHSHLHRDTRRLTDREVLADLARSRAVVERATGRPMLPYFRPPYGARNARTDRLAAAAGFPTIVMWDVTAADTVRGTTTRRVIRAATGGRPGSIVLLHAGPKVTVRALPAIIARYRERGYRFVALPELFGDPWPAVSHWPAAGPSPAARALDRAGDEAAAPAPAQGTNAPGGPAAPVGGGDPIPSEVPLPPAIPAATEAPAPAAREAAWARSAGTPGALAVATVSLLLGVLGLASLAGRGVGPEGDIPA